MRGARPRPGDGRVSAPAAITDQHLDGNDRKIELIGNRVEPLPAGDAGPVEDLDEYPRGREACQASQVDGGFRVSGTPKHSPSSLAIKAGTWPGRTRSLDRVVGSTIARIGVRARSSAADPGPAALVVHHHGEGAAMGGGGLGLDHRVQIEPLGLVGRDRDAQLPGVPRQ